MLLTDHQIITIFPTEAGAAALAASLTADDPDTEYRVLANERGFYVAIFDDGEQLFTL